ncbi:hypothetical protein [Algoriphagus confluentis]|uniref:Aerotolerance regulator N-terminal domain-containing protein n=1 Tax=Algoriphagus confluentis TaxID=1697556 RepID=A0ABQ6PIC9_9BACT|nr:hypothetical protein Aconfl_02810 [Algoriphagus confluentis]
MSLSFDPITSDFFLWTILILVLGIGLAFVFFYGKKGISKNRLWVKTGLFFGFWAFLAISLLRPHVSDLKDSKPWLVYEESLEQAELDFWMDSLGLEKSVGISDFDLHSDPVVLLGKQFSKEELYFLRGKQVSWILPREQGIIRDISWKGYLRKGEVQRVSFSVFSSKSDQKLSLGIPQVDSVALVTGWNEGLLEFRPSGQGRAELPLVLEKDTLAVLRYFIGPAVPKKYQVQMGFPSAESRTLANWLREKGETVSEQIQLSRETFLQSNPQSDSLQVRIIDPAQLKQKSVQDWVKGEMGNLMLIQVSDPLALTQQVNRLFGTDFELESAGSELENGLEALPFSWKEKPGQEVFQENRIAIQRLGNAQIGISLLESTYPLLLEGKKESYEEIWGDVFGAMEPAEPRSKRLDAPVFQGLEAQIQLFDQDSLPEIWSAGEDTVWLKRSAINPFLAEGTWQATSIGWIDSGTDFSVYGYGLEELPAVRTARNISDLERNSNKIEESQSSPLSPWIGLIGMFLFLGAMWLEPKL